MRWAYVTQMRFTTSTGLRLAAVVAVAALFFTDATVRAAVTKTVSGVDLASLDRTCKPCTDFYQFANGNWIKNNPIPAAYPSWGEFNILAENNRNVLHGILEKAAADKSAALGSNEQKIGDFYASCMDTAAIEKAGTAPLAPLMATISELKDTKQLGALVAKLESEGGPGFFGFGAGADAKDSSQDIAQLFQGGLGLPDRDYYLKDDEKSKALRDAYTKHVATMFTLLGEPQTQADADANTVLAMETTLAKAAVSRVTLRDPQKRYNKMSVAELQKLSPNFDWNAYFSGSGVSFTTINVVTPDFFKGFSDAIATWTPAQIQTYLRWHAVHSLATALPKAFDDANFAFYSTTLQGVTEQLPRWKRCTRATDNTLGEALGQSYVAQAFPPAAKARALQLVKYVKQTLRDDMSTLTWMSAPTQKRAMAKLDAFTLKIGYPDKWLSYATLPITRQSYAANLIAATQFENKRDYGKIGHPVDKTEWGMTPPTVNAYYNPSINEIVFPAGILQPPFFQANADMAVNFGAVGAVIGHESTHGFDDSGRQFDAEGNLVDWWQPADSTAFDKRAQCIIDQFDALQPIPGVHENGKLVTGEAIADLGGLTIAYKAFERYKKEHPEVNKTLDGFTPEQRFFLGFAHIWAANERPQYVSLLAQTDPHPFDKFRVNATLSNMPEFAAAWHCPMNVPMVRPANQRCQIW